MYISYGLNLSIFEFELTQKRTMDSMFLFLETSYGLDITDYKYAMYHSTELLTQYNFLTEENQKGGGHFI